MKTRDVVAYLKHDVAVLEMALERVVDDVTTCRRLISALEVALARLAEPTKAKA